MKCPIDQSTLAMKESERVVARTCGLCRGLFLDGKGVAAFKYNHETDILQKLDQFPSNGQSSIDCPCCHSNMNCLSINTVDIDYCQTCQCIWFDKNELTKIISEYSCNHFVEDKLIDTSLILEAVVNFIAMFL